MKLKAVMRNPFCTALATAAFALLFWAGATSADDAVRCDGKLLGIGRSRIEVLKYCGEPQDRISYLDERTTHARFAVIQQGTVQSTRRISYYMETSRDATTTSEVNRDQGKGNDGRPVSLEQNHTHDESKLVRDETSQTSSSYLTISTFWECKKRTYHVDEFTYNFGTGKFMTFFMFENGKVKGIKYGEYGF